MHTNGPEPGAREKVQEKAKAYIAYLQEKEKAPAKPPPTIGVDFDGTLCDFSYPGIGKVKYGAKEALQQFRDLGYRIVIWTCRTCHYHYDIFGGDPKQPTLERPFVKDMIEWLDANEIPYDEVDDGSRGKLHADFYIDDKAIAFQNNWNWIAANVMFNTPMQQVLAAKSAREAAESNSTGGQCRMN